MANIVTGSLDVMGEMPDLDRWEESIPMAPDATPGLFLDHRPGDPGAWVDGYDEDHHTYKRTFMVTSRWAPPIAQVDRIAEAHPELEFILTWDSAESEFLGASFWSKGRRTFLVDRPWTEAEINSMVTPADRASADNIPV